MWPMLRCKDAAAFILAREDRPLDLPETLRLQLHLVICKACPDFENQIVAMRKLMRAWQAHDDIPPEDSTEAGKER